MGEYFRKQKGNKLVLVLSADEFTPKSKGYVVYEQENNSFFGNPFGVIWKSKKDAIEQAKLRLKF